MENNNYIHCLWNKFVELCSDPALGISVFGAVKLIKNANIDQYKHSRYGIGFDMKGTISFPTLGFGKNVIIFGDMRYEFFCTCW